MLADCRAEVCRHAPPPADDESDGETKVQVVTLRRLMPESTLEDTEAVESWVEDLRRRLVELVKLGPVRLVDREDD